MKSSIELEQPTRTGSHIGCWCFQAEDLANRAIMLGPHFKDFKNKYGKESKGID